MSLMSSASEATDPFRLAQRVQINLRADEAGDPSPIAVMSRIYPGMFGNSLSSSSAADVKPTGEPPLDLGVGRYLKTSPIVRQAVLDGLKGVDLHYRRMPELGELIAHKYRAEQGVAIDPERNIFLTAGARAAMSLAMLRFLEPAMKVVVPDPDYVGLAMPARGFGGWVVRAPMQRNSDGRLTVDVDAMISAIGASCGLVILTNPNNPTGLTWPREALQAVADAARRAGAKMLINEVYDVLTFDGERHHSGLSLKDNDHVMVVSGTGKSYDITGLGFGWIAGAEGMIRPLADVAFMFHVPIPSFPALLGGRAALSDPIRVDHPRRSVAILSDHARKAAEAFALVPGFRFPQVQAGQFGFPWIGVDDLRFSEIVREEIGVAVMPGSAWGRMGRGHLRIALANPPSHQAKALHRFAEFLRRFDAAAYDLPSVPMENS